MELFTRSKDINWNRIVDICINQNDDLNKYIKDKDTCKLIIITSGAGIAEINGKDFILASPMLVCLNPDKSFTVKSNSNLQACVLYFKPNVINDTFSHDKIMSGHFNNMNGTTTYQDLMLLKGFYNINENSNFLIKLTSSNVINVQNLLSKIEKELLGQVDGFWPCRSRSYLFELLCLINSLQVQENENTSNEELKIDNKTIAEIICYLNENLSQKISVDMLSKKFLINRNKLNEEFKKYTGLTSIQYLLKIRMNLSCILLSNTDLPISEISERVGFSDNNYFIKAFKNYYNVTPSKFRKG